VHKGEFAGIRGYLGKTQKELAQTPRNSLKAIQSFEQGWRRIPVHVERQALFRSCPSRSRVRQKQTDLLDHNKMPQGEQTTLPGMGIPF